MGMKSQRNGNLGEAIVERFFRKRGYWVHITKRAANGSQPVDVIAIKGDKAVLVDAKYVSAGKNGRFYFEDVQPDQVTALRYASDFAGIRNIGFAIVFEGYEDHPSFLSFAYYEAVSILGQTSVCRTYLDPLEEWEEVLWK